MVDHCEHARQAVTRCAWRCWCRVPAHRGRCSLRCRPGSISREFGLLRAKRNLIEDCHTGSKGQRSDIVGDAEIRFERTMWHEFLRCRPNFSGVRQITRFRFKEKLGEKGRVSGRLWPLEQNDSKSCLRPNLPKFQNRKTSFGCHIMYVPKHIVEL